MLGGTAQARQLAQTPAPRPAFRVATSFAGRVAHPRASAEEVRAGGLGGPAGTADRPREHRVDTVTDATHPCAAEIGAARDLGLPVVVRRPPLPRGVPVVPDVAGALARSGRRTGVSRGAADMCP
ncbi:precorrin-6A/cobalt-precorrin-6A reductase [Streptomyces sp. A5-4]|uniref:precorrin-6A/cobalt-precorrin-6A reductase n=1 Tax=Streptomyces sp. A5-4 TaxID=3384771 RepID=UPI003DA95B0A